LAVLPAAFYLSESEAVNLSAIVGANFCFAFCRGANNFPRGWKLAKNKKPIQGGTLRSAYVLLVGE